MSVVKYNKRFCCIKSLLIVALLSILLVGCTQTNTIEEKSTSDKAEQDVNSDSLYDNTVSENTNNFITKDFVMDVEDAHFKVTLEKVDVKIEDSAKENLKDILSSVSLINKTNEEVFVSIKHSWSDDVMESKIPANSSDNIKISTQISKDINIEDTSVCVEIKSKDNKVIFKHSFGIASETKK